MNDAAIPFVRLLGAPHVTLAPRSLPLLPDKRHQLLAYLAYQGGWVSRARLAFLFWPDAPEDTARRNLRRLLHRVRELGWLAGLAVQGERLSWAVSTDVTDFEAAVQGGHWALALDHYGGSLLDGLDGMATGEYASWLMDERARLHGLWHSALLQRAQELEGTGDPGRAAALLEPRLGEDELDEELVCTYMRASWRAGRSAQALHAYAAFCGRLRRDVGLSPSPATEHLAHAIQAQAPGPVQGMTPPLAARPAVPTPFMPLIGRELELAEISHALGRAECRLLTLTGPGGAGKTRIALEAARTLGLRYPGGAAFAALETTDSPERLPISVAEALGLTLWGADPPAVQVIRHLAASPRLLVLDNYEHLLDGAPFVAELLRGCPELRLLVTSRERLHLSSEWLLPVDGLPVPPDSATLAQAATYDAVTLFVERVTRVRPGYVLTEEDLPHVLTICRLMGGLPLGLELAAVWVRVIPPREIAAEIAVNLDFLTSDERDVDARHASLRATFEYSWARLRPAEQQLLRQLSVCEGGFGYDAARTVAGASLPLLARLVDQSLLRASPSGRYHRHPLLSAFTREKLAGSPAEDAAARARHGAHYLNLLCAHSDALRGPRQSEALARLDEELENVRAAWHWAVEGARVAELGPPCGALATYHDRRARYQEGVDLLGRAADALEGAGADHGAVLARLQLEGAWLLYRLSRLDDAEHRAQRGLALAHAAGNSEAVMLGLNVQGALCWRRGEYAAAQDFHRAAAALARSRADQAGLERSLHLLAIAGADGGNVQSAEQDFRAALDLCRSVGHLAESVLVLNNLGCLLDAAGRHGEAVALLEEALSQSRDLASPHVRAHLLSSLAHALYQHHDLIGSRIAGEEALGLAQALGVGRLEAVLEVGLGRAAAGLGEAGRAQALLRRGLAALWAGQELPDVLRTLLGWTEWHLAHGDATAAADLLQVVLRHPATRHADRERARRMWNGAGSDECGDPPELAATVTAILTTAP
ncbi:ATP-binding protein [Deinococcus yunweiensis]|uniref:ATP-binding protein n=1 Tax=Deinococcus yunweiensis TaxID=367282 RepID=UPI00398EC358